MESIRDVELKVFKKDGTNHIWLNVIPPDNAEYKTKVEIDNINALDVKVISNNLLLPIDGSDNKKIFDKINSENYKFSLMVDTSEESIETGRIFYEKIK